MGKESAPVSVSLVTAEITPFEANPIVTGTNIVDAPILSPDALRKQYYQERSPMGGELPSPSERGPVSAELLNTSHHELQHALVALAHGAKVKSVSVKQEGLTRGRTELDGFISLGKFKIIAAAGAVNTSGAGPARGYGMDLYQISVANFLEGMSPNNHRPYILMAENTLNAHYSSEVRKRAATILAIKGEISGSDLPLILAQAKFELKMDGITFENIEEMQEAENNLLELERSFDYDDRNKIVEARSIEEFEDHSIKIEWVESNNQDILHEEIFCPNCGLSTDGHAPYCQSVRYKDKLQEGKGPSDNPKDSNPDERNIYESSDKSQKSEVKEQLKEKGVIFVDPLDHKRAETLHTNYEN